MLYSAYTDIWYVFIFRLTKYNYSSFIRFQHMLDIINYTVT